MHTIAAKAVALRIAASEPFRAAPAPDDRQRPGARDRPRSQRRPGSHRRHRRPPGPRRPTPTGLDGKTAEDRLEEVGITVNRNAIPFDERPPMNPSGLRIGTPALTTRGLNEEDMEEIAAVIATALGRRLRVREGLPRRAHRRPDGPLPAVPAALADGRLESGRPDGRSGRTLS